MLYKTDALQSSASISRFSISFKYEYHHRLAVCKLVYCTVVVQGTSKFFFWHTTIQPFCLVLFMGHYKYQRERCCKPHYNSTRAVLSSLQILQFPVFMHVIWMKSSRSGIKYIKPILIIEDLYVQTSQEHQDKLSQQSCIAFFLFSDVFQS